ncbi:nuclease-related domain-containing protein [Bailinhaonella thermotolerans]|nr:nuclease-related domain-containing protein [Bailinhaonella thermotolerans]
MLAGLAAQPPARWLAVAAALALVAVAAVTGSRAASLWTRASQAAVGVRSEQQVRQVLRRAQPPVVCYGLVLGRGSGDCDVALATRGLGAVVIEVKTGYGQVRARNETLWAGRKALPRDPVGQARSQARLLSQALTAELGRPVEATAVVCLPGMTNAPFVTRGVYVCSAADLPGVLHRVPGQFATVREAERAFDRLWARQSSRT